MESITKSDTETEPSNQMELDDHMLEDAGNEENKSKFFQVIHQLFFSVLLYL